MEESQKEKKPAGAVKISEDKVITLLSYIGILFLVPLLLKKEDKFAKFHAKQGLVLCIGWIFTWVPYIGWLLWIVLAIFSIWGIVNVINGKYTKLPLVGDLAEKFNL
jgi:uncharacterized membrane protein